jgi:hypothetical protein
VRYGQGQFVLNIYHDVSFQERLGKEIANCSGRELRNVHTGRTS